MYVGTCFDFFCLSYVIYVWNVCSYVFTHACPHVCTLVLCVQVHMSA